jgi:hypothetical protein
MKLATAVKIMNGSLKQKLPNMLVSMLYNFSFITVSERLAFLELS